MLNIVFTSVSVILGGFSLLRLISSNNVVLGRRAPCGVWQVLVPVCHCGPS